MRLLSISNPKGFLSDENFSYPDVPKLEDVVNVSMKCVGVTTAAHSKPFVGTTGLWGCVGLMLYDADAKVGALSHVWLDYLSAEQSKYFDISRNVPEHIEELLLLAGIMGGKRYAAHVVNAPSPVRKGKHNRAIMERMISECAKYHIPIHAFYVGRLPIDFKLDTRTGVILPYGQ